MLSKMIVFITTTILGSVGWWAGAHLGMVSAFILAMVGTGVGIYYGKQLADHYAI